MDKQELVEKLIDLAKGRLTADQWIARSANNAQSMEQICGRTMYLKIKPSKSFSDIRNVHYAQIAVSD